MEFRIRYDDMIIDHHPDPDPKFNDVALVGLPNSVDHPAALPSPLSVGYGC